MTRLYVFFILLISTFVYKAWINFNIFSFSDWRFRFVELEIERINLLSWVSTNDFGEVNLMIWRTPYDVFHGLFGYAGFASNVADKYIILWPIVILAGISSYIIVRYITRSNIAGFVGSFILAYNTYFLGINSQGHLLLTIAFIFGVFSLYFFVKLLAERKMIFAFFTAIFLFIVGSYDLRSFYIVFGIQVLYLIYYFIFVKNFLKKRYVKELITIVFPLVVVIPLSFYWLLPTLFANMLTDNAQLGRIISFSEFYKIQHAISLHFPFWTGLEPSWDQAHPIPWYFWMYPIFAVAGLWVNRRNKNIVFFGIIALIGIVLTKQVHIPFPNLYNLLYDNIPGFNAFREASKFYFLIALGYAVLIGSFIAYIWKNWNNNNWQVYGKYIFTLGIVLIALWNAKPIITGEIKSLFVPRTIPGDMITTKDFIFNQKEYFRTFWIHPSNHWRITTNNHPRIDPDNTIQGVWSQYLESNYTRTTPKGQIVMESMQQPVMNDLLDLHSVKYVFLHLDDPGTDDYIAESYEMPRQYFLDEIEKLDYLQPIDIGTEQILAYENENYRPHIYTTTQKDELGASIEFSPVSHNQINPSEYRLTLNNLKEPVYLYFTDTYHSDWKLRVGDFSWFDVIVSNDYFLDDSIHESSSVGLNVFRIDPEYIASTVRSGEYTQNEDGSITFDATLYFRPQSYLYLGVIISGATLLFIVVGILYLSIRNRK